MTEPKSTPAPGTDRSRRRTLGPVVLLGLASALLVAVAGAKPWAQAAGASADRAALAATQVSPGQMPAANALGLVTLACWGVVLVSRGRVRRGVAVLATLAALGVLATVAIGFTSTPDAVRAAFATTGVSGVDVGRTGWFWVAAVAGLLSVLATGQAVRLLPSWPEMGRRYDTPTGATTPEDERPVGEQSSLDLWKAMDEGHDPTA